jgi:hypothetical protein
MLVDVGRQTKSSGAGGKGVKNGDCCSVAGGKGRTDSV